MHGISSYRGNRPTNTSTHKQTGPIAIHCAQCKYFASCLCVAINTERVYQSMQTLVSDDSQTSSDSTRAYKSIRRRVAKVTSPSPFRFFRTFHVVITYTPFRPFSLYDAGARFPKDLKIMLRPTYNNNQSYDILNDNLTTMPSFKKSYASLKIC